MIYLFDAGNRETHGQYLEQSFRQRHEFFYKLRGWHHQFSFFNMEIDQYDSRLATYLLSIDDNGVVMGGIRVMSTNFGTYIGEFHGPSITDSKYPACFGENTWEMYRLWVSNPGWRSATGHKVLTEIMLSLMEYLADVGAERVLATGDIPHLEKLPPSWSWREIAPRYSYEEHGRGSVEAMIVEIDISHQMVEATKKFFKFSGKHYMRAEDGLKPRPSLILPEEFSIVNKWLSINPDKVREAVALAEGAQSNQRDLVRFKAMVYEATRAGMLGQFLDNSLTNVKVH
ncbi:MAG: hypothetical protein JKY60_20405 [Kordiimonadaceae bacterium]|nr:hypothetical protein [Kordiimonadaceae bacterium]